MSKCAIHYRKMVAFAKQVFSALCSFVSTEPHGLSRFRLGELPATSVYRVLWTTWQFHVKQISSLYCCAVRCMWPSAYAFTDTSFPKHIDSDWPWLPETPGFPFNLQSSVQGQHFDSFDSRRTEHGRPAALILTNVSSPRKRTWISQAHNRSDINQTRVKGKPSVSGQQLPWNCKSCPCRGTETTVTSEKAPQLD